MTTISFTESLLYTRTFTETALISITTNHNGSNNYVAHILNELVYIRTPSGALVCVDLNSHFTR